MENRNVEMKQMMEWLLDYLNDNLQPAYHIDLERFATTYPALCLRAQKEIVKDHYTILGEYHARMEFAVYVRMEATAEDDVQSAYRILNDVDMICQRSFPSLGSGLQCEKIEMISNPAAEKTNETQGIDFMAQFAMEYRRNIKN